MSRLLFFIHNYLYCFLFSNDFKIKKEKNKEKLNIYLIYSFSTLKSYINKN